MNKNLRNKLLKHYRYLHSVPEAGFIEHKTKEYIMSELEKFSDLRIIYKGQAGLIYDYIGNIKKNSHYDIAFRAELDAVELDEIKGLYYHSCGHDAHSTILLGLMEYIITNKPKINILFVFQASEEKYGGAKYICNILRNRRFKVEKFYAMHVTSDLYSNYISINKGDILAAGITCNLKIMLKGEGHVSGS